MILIISSNYFRSLKSVSFRLALIELETWSENQIRFSIRIRNDCEIVDGPLKTAIICNALPNIIRYLVCVNFYFFLSI